MPPAPPPRPAQGPEAALRGFQQLRHHRQAMTSADTKSEPDFLPCTDTGKPLDYSVAKMAEEYADLANKLDKVAEFMGSVQIGPETYARLFRLFEERGHEPKPFESFLEEVLPYSRIRTLVLGEYQRHIPRNILAP